MKTYNAPENTNACPDGMQTFRSWEEIAQAIVTSGEVRLFGKETILGLSITKDGLYVQIGTPDDELHPRPAKIFSKKA